MTHYECHFARLFSERNYYNRKERYLYTLTCKPCADTIIKNQYTIKSWKSVYCADVPLDGSVFHLLTEHHHFVFLIQKPGGWRSQASWGEGSARPQASPGFSSRLLKPRQTAWGGLGTRLEKVCVGYRLSLVSAQKASPNVG